MRFHRTPLITLAVCSLLLTGERATAEEPSAEGVVKLGYKIRANSSCVPSADNCDGCRSGYGYGTGRRLGSRVGRGRCSTGRHHAAGLNGGHYGYGCNPHYSHCGIGHLLNKLSPYHVCTHAPDHGFAPPADRPIWPRSAMYSRMFPAKWTGENRGLDPSFRHPLIYMPTDTTQLGYYYQHVPFWRSAANMIPPVPQPAEWHTPDTGVTFTGYEDVAVPSGYGASCPQEMIVGAAGETAYPSAQPVPPVVSPTPVPSNRVPMQEANPEPPYSPEPVTPQMVPPAQEASPLPALPSGTRPRRPSAADLEKSAALPLLIPVPPQ